jgi:SulP family sulfate permease
MFGSSFVNAIPLAGLIGVMFMVVIGTFKWESLKYGGKIPKNDMIVVIAVTAVTVYKDLASAVILGVILAALMFAWEKGKVIYANIEEGADGSRRYKINGTLFFGSVLNFKELFDVANDPHHVILDLRYAKVMDHSAIEAIDKIAGRYAAAGKRLTLSRVSRDCRLLFQNASKITTIHIEDIETSENPFPFAHHPKVT